MVGIPPDTPPQSEEGDQSPPIQEHDHAEIPVHNIAGGNAASARSHGVEEDEDTFHDASDQFRTPDQSRPPSAGHLSASLSGSSLAVHESNTQGGVKKNVSPNAQVSSFASPPDGGANTHITEHAHKTLTPQSHARGGGGSSVASHLASIHAPIQGGARTSNSQNDKHEPERLSAPASPACAAQDNSYADSARGKGYSSDYIPSLSEPASPIKEESIRESSVHSTRSGSHTGTVDPWKKRCGPGVSGKRDAPGTSTSGSRGSMSPMST